MDKGVVLLIGVPTDVLPDHWAEFVPELLPDGAHCFREIVIFYKDRKLRLPLQVDERDFVAINIYVGFELGRIGEFCLPQQTPVAFGKLTREFRVARNGFDENIAPRALFGEPLEYVCRYSCFETTEIFVRDDFFFLA